MKTVSKVENKQIKTKPKKEKKPPYPGKTACKATFILGIIATISLIALASAPYLIGMFATFLFMFASVGVIITTIMSMGVFWTFEGFRKFWANTFNVIIKMFDSPNELVNALKPSIIYVSLALLAFAIAGFVVNLVFFIKHKQNKAKFIVSCVFLGLAILFTVLTIVGYLTYK